MPDDNRKLAAIVFVDIVGYTAMMSKNVNQTLDIVDRIRSTIKEGATKFQGNLLKEMGDGFLLSFQSPSKAIRCSLFVQQSIIDDDVTVRIGIHVGEVINRNNDIYGDGINIASRLQGIASPSTIYISGRVYEDIANNPEFHVKYRGEKKLKNVGRPIKVYEMLEEASTELFVRKIIVRHKSLFVTSSIVVLLALLFSFIYVKFVSENQTSEVKLTDEEGNEIVREIPKGQYLKKICFFSFSYLWQKKRLDVNRDTKHDCC
jgi:class 3 adenylate cyclase